MTERKDISALKIDRSPDRSPNRWRRVMVSLFILLLIVLGVFGFFSLSANFSEPEVDVAIVTRTSGNSSNMILTASGYVVAQRKAAVASKGTGRLEFLGVEEGDQVKRGQVIARLENSDMVAALERARAELMVAKADSAEAALNLLRYEMLDSLNMTAKVNVDAAQTTYMRVLANIGTAAARIKEAEVAVENTVIYAPFDGTVLTKDADVGEIVAPFAASSNSRGAVVTIADMSSLEVETDVSESNITKVRLNQPCEIVLDAYPDQRYRGYVKKIVPTADRGKATVLTKVAFYELDNRVLPEMSAKVQFLSEEIPEGQVENQPVLTLPSTALVQRGDEMYVLMVNDEIVEERAVQTGRSMGGRTEILAGLEQNDQVIRQPNGELKNGTRVRIKS